MNKTRVAELSDDEAIRLFEEDPVKNFDVLRNRHVDGGDVILNGNQKITALPDGLTFGSDLNLNHCTSLTSLPEGLRVDNDLSLYGCTSLTSLPKKLRVGGYLDLGYCVSLTSLPEDFSVGGDIFIYGCTKLKVWLVKERKIEWLRRKVKGQIEGLI